MGRFLEKNIEVGAYWWISLLQAPSDFTQAFDQALKNTVVAIPNRPAKEAGDDVVRDFKFGRDSCG